MSSFHNTTAHHEPATDTELSHNANNSNESQLSKAIDKEQDDDDESKYPKGINLFLIMTCIVLSTFLVALDGTIISTALPTITSEFDSLDDYSWYSAAFFLTQCTFQLPFGRAYSLVSTKWIFIFAIVMFEIGSAICGAAPNSIALIVGRAIAGIGSAGVFGGAFITLSEIAPLRKRAIYAGAIGGAFAIASVVGPILGGAFTSDVTWRWCFYINLPIGGVVLAIVVAFLPRFKKNPSSKAIQSTLFQKLNYYDPFGSIILLGSVTCLILALQWGGQTYPWSDGRIIALLVVFGVSFVAWAGLQYWENETATVPRKVFMQRSVACVTFYLFLQSAAFCIVIYYLPIWFQAIMQDSAEESGIKQIALVLSVVVATVSAGGAVVFIGYYTQFLYLGTILTSVGAGLFTLLTPNTSIGPIIGFEILFGLGIGCSAEQCNVAVQSSLPQELIPAGTSIVVFARSLGGVIGVAIAENVFERQLINGLSAALPGMNTDFVSSSGATDLIANVLAATGGDEAVVSTVLQVYTDAIVQTFYAAVALACLTLIPALGVEWRSVKKQGKTRSDEEKGPSNDVGTESVAEAGFSQEKDVSHGLQDGSSAEDGE